MMVAVRRVEDVHLVATLVGGDSAGRTVGDVDEPHRDVDGVGRGPEGGVRLPERLAPRGHLPAFDIARPRTAAPAPETVQSR